MPALDGATALQAAQKPTDQGDASDGSGGGNGANNQLVVSASAIANALNVSSERTTFLMVGGFYLCQMQANGLDGEKLADATKLLIEKASSLTPNNVTPGGPSKPESPKK